MSLDIYISRTLKYCPKCKASIESYLGADLLTIICNNCSSIIEYPNGKLDNDVKSIDTDFKTRILTIGSVGQIKEIKYKVVGYACKKENGANYFWHEYILFNQNLGVVFLTNFDGHWTLLNEILNTPVVKNTAITFENEYYNIFLKYSYVIKKADGEFPYLFSDSKLAKVSEFINPPFLLSCEKIEKKTKWYKGEYIDYKEIEKGFNISNISKPKGIGAIQLSNSKIRKKPLLFSVFVATILWFIFQYYFYTIASNKLIFSKTIEVVDSTSGKDFYTESFSFNDGTKNLQINLNCNVSNSWEYTAFTLVNESTGDIYELDMEVEYYSGYEGGESWSEGSINASKFISSIPNGKYHLIIHPEKPISDNTLLINVDVYRDVFMPSNGVLLIIFLLIYPIFYILKQQWFERRRWSNSNYSPYN